MTVEFFYQPKRKTTDTVLENMALRRTFVPKRTGRDGSGEKIRMRRNLWVYRSPDSRMMK